MPGTFDAEGNRTSVRLWDRLNLLDILEDAQS